MCRLIYLTTHPKRQEKGTDDSECLRVAAAPELQLSARLRSAIRAAAPAGRVFGAAASAVAQCRGVPKSRVASAFGSVDGAFMPLRRNPAAHNGKSARQYSIIKVRGNWADESPNGQQAGICTHLH